MRRFLAVLALGVVLVGALIGVRTAQFVPLSTPPLAPATFAPDEAAAARHLGEAIRFPTVSYEQPEHRDASALASLHEWLVGAYPRTHVALKRELVGGSLLYTWAGRESTLEPLVLMGHLDVVPVDPGTEAGWAHPPFDGVVADGYIWGRGSMDDKSSVIAVMEAVEALVGEGFTPARTVYLAFGQDEELGGLAGGRVLAKTLVDRGMSRAALVVDEGGMVANVPGMPEPAALVGIAEKGFLSLELSVRAPGGHSSAPPPETGIGILARAITRLEEHPFEARLDGATRRMLEAIGPSLGLTQRAGLANLWLFEPLVLRRLVSSPETAAMVRTTTAPTILQAGVKENVLPILSRAIVNFRILPGDTRESVTARVRTIVDDPRVEIRQGTPFSTEPSPVSDPDGPGFALVARSARSALAQKDLVIAPYLVIGGTDSRYYAEHARAVLRFFPARLGPGDIRRIHGTDERLPIADLAAGVRFFHELLRGSDAL